MGDLLRTLFYKNHTLHLYHKGANSPKVPLVHNIEDGKYNKLDKEPGEPTTRRKIWSNICTNIFTILVSFVCIANGSVCYYNSLEGGTVEWVHAHMSYLAKNMVMAVVSYFVGFSLLFYLRTQIHIYLWFLIMINAGAALGGMLTLDMGASLQRHGLFNIIMLIALSIPLVFYLLSWKAAFKLLGKQKGTILHVFLVIAAVVTILHSRSRLKANWPVGLFNEELEFNSHGVTIPSDFVPWQSLQPRGWNFVLGQSCPRQKHFASLEDGVLRIDCDPAKKPYYIEYPNFLAERDECPRDLVYIKNVAATMQQKHDYTSPVKLQAEVVQAYCGDLSELFMQSVESDTVKARLSPPVQTSTGLPHAPNVLVLYIDALSRAHFYRRMPRTAKTLTHLQKFGRASVYQFFKYHALGPHTGPNTIPLYTGGINLWENQSPDFVGDFQYDFDQFPFWWQNYSDAKYVRSWVPGFCENWPDTYVKKTFPEGAVDHLMVLPFCHPDAFPLKDPLGPFSGPYSIRRRCIGDRKVHTYSLQYAQEFFTKYPGSGKISTVGFMEAHEGSMEIIAQVDEDLANFLDYGLGDEFNNTFVVIVSDHGNHMSPYYVWTTGGPIENRLPALFIITPNWFTERYPTLAKNLRENQNRLLTARDIYRTLAELSKLPEFGGDTKEKLKGLLDILPDRSCEEANISQHMCVFEKYTR